MKHADFGPDREHAFLLDRIDYERTSAIPYGQSDFKLDRMLELLDRLGNPHHRLRVVHVAGTKGKGSTAAMTAAILSAAGYRTGLYTSPHLDRIEERMAVDGAPCSPDAFVRLIERVRPTVSAMDVSAALSPGKCGGPTYFEVLTALGFLYFVDQQVDLAVLEVGLGGRLDSTNVCLPAVSVITSISFDHTRQLGNTLAEIAREKAGIIKPGIPVVSGVVGREPRDVIESIALQRGAKLAELGVDFSYEYHPPGTGAVSFPACRFDFHYASDMGCHNYLGLSLNLRGEHQAANASVALAAIAELRRQGWGVPEEAMRKGLAGVVWPARVEVIGRDPTIVLDAAHNVASIEALIRALDESFSAAPRLLVFATTQDKDISGMLRLVLPEFDAVIFTRYFNNPRAVPPERLAALAGELSTIPVHTAPDPRAAWNLAQTFAGADHLIAITGSFFIAAEMRAAIRDSPPCAAGTSSHLP